MRLGRVYLGQKVTGPSLPESGKIVDLYLVGNRSNVKIKMESGYIVHKPLDEVCPFSKRYDPNSDEFDPSTEMNNTMSVSIKVQQE